MKRKRAGGLRTGEGPTKAGLPEEREDDGLGVTAGKKGTQEGAFAKEAHVPTRGTRGLHLPNEEVGGGARWE